MISIPQSLRPFAVFALLAGNLLLTSCATPIDSRDPAIYRPAPAHYPPLP